MAAKEEHHEYTRVHSLIHTHLTNTFMAEMFPTLQDEHPAPYHNFSKKLTRCLGCRSWADWYNTSSYLQTKRREDQVFRGIKGRQGYKKKKRKACLPKEVLQDSDTCLLKQEGWIERISFYTLILLY